MQSFGPNIWIAEGPTVNAAAGFAYPTRMAVIRLESGELVIWSPVALTNALAAAVNTLGNIAYLVSPNSLHDSFLADWQRAYPDAMVCAPPGLREKRRDIRFDLDFSNGPIAQWAGAIDFAIIAGNRITTEVVFFHHESQTTLVTDLIQQFPRGWFSGWRAVVARLDLMVAHEPSVPRKFRLAFTDRNAARQSLATVLAWPTERLILAHGPVIGSGGQAVLRRAFGWLMRR
ncbi:DUF4336 domain-containing protein [Devosia aquimaris]|uniref:DUF4336 domain-containing protein n=1 Tax=Devosia aquimaris TaxID=2866214 RepID=UPI001CD18FD2|nr:DUF4336 domain-containing protein [Devosia sp. CJK-A8-3]